jgi:glutamate racemase
VFNDETDEESTKAATTMVKNNLLAGQIVSSISVPEERRARVVVFDSGVGGLTVAQAIRGLTPDVELHYLADQAFFPYGSKPENEVRERVLKIIGEVIHEQDPDLVVIACNTASTLALEALRERYSTPIVGTVPPIKVAAENSVSRVFSVLGTPATITRTYTHDLIETYASDCNVKLVGALNLAKMAEALLSGEDIDLEALKAEIEPCFIEINGKRTDVIALSCTHYPILSNLMSLVAPWPVIFVDPAPAVARRTAHLLARRGLWQGEGQITWHSTAGQSHRLSASGSRLGIIAPLAQTMTA